MASVLLRSFAGALLASAFVIAAPISATAEERADVIHWFTSEGESKAIGVFIDAFEKDGGDWLDSAVAGSGASRTAALSRLLGGQPPTAMQVNVGFQVKELARQGLLENVSDVAREMNWDTFLPATIRDAASRDGVFYGAPFNIHGQNWLFYNPAVLEKVGVEPPQSWNDFLRIGPTLKGAGVIPLALGGQNWQEYLLFNAVLAEGGRDLFHSVYVEPSADAVRSDAFRKAVETFGKLREFVDPASPGRNWNDTTALVMKGDAAMQVMGDWAKGEFSAAGLELGKDYGCQLGVGNDLFVISGDTFVFPKTSDEEQREAQRLLARTLMGKEAQLAFNAIAGSVPTRQDVDTAGLDPCAKKSVEALASPERQIASPNLALRPDVEGAVVDVVSQFWNDSSMSVDAMVDAFASAIEGS